MKRYIVWVAALTAWPASLVVGQNPGPMRKEASPGFDVATIKPTDPTMSRSGFKINGRRILALRENLVDLITMAYGLHPSQVQNTPSWGETEYFDVNGEPDEPGVPNLDQMRGMYRKLLSERFHLSFHRAQKELAVYVIRVGKNGPKLRASARAGSVPDQTLNGSGNLRETNATMAEFAGMLQVTVLDRPVLDETGLSGRFDFTLQWTPDEFQISGGARPPDTAGARPSLTTAVQEQLGLKLEATRAPVEVFIIDQVEKPSGN